MNFVYIPVPEEHATQVHALLVKLADGGGSNDSNAAADGGGESALGWTEEDLERLSKSPQESVQRVARMLDLLSQSPGEPISYTAIADSLHLTRGELQGALSGFTRWIRKNWSTTDGSGWPMDVTYRDAQTQGQASESYYIVTSIIANLWLAVRLRSSLTDGDPT